MPKKTLPVQAIPAIVKDHVQMWGLAIHTQRMFQRITTAQLAQRIGVSIPTVTRLEKGDTGVSIGTYITALFAVGLRDAIPVLDAALWQTKTNQRMRPKKSELGAQFGYF
jgi:transcriptional regulator with XRE-family HTH domain